MKWPRVPLEEVADWSSGGTPSRSREEYFGPGVPWLSIADLTDGPVDSAAESLTPLGMENSSAKLLPAGTILVAMYGSIGKLGMTQRPMATSQAIAAARPNLSRLEGSYLFHFLRWMRPQLQAMGRGGTQMNIGQGDLKCITIPLPPLDEQRRIATILDRAAELVRLTAQATALEGALLRGALMRVIANLDDRRAPLSSEADIVSGITKGRKLSSEAQTQEVPYLAVSNVQAGHLNLTSVKTIAVTPAELERYRLQRDDLLLTEGGDPDKLGRGTLWREELPLSLHQNHVFRVRLKRGASLRPAMLAAWVASSESRRYFLRSAKQTTGIASINKAQLGELPVPVMDGATQARFEAELKAIERAVEPLRQRQAVVHVLFETVQARAFSGEL